MRFMMMPIRIHVECIVHTNTCVSIGELLSYQYRKLDERESERENAYAFVYFIIWWMRARMYFSVNLKPYFGIGGNEIQHIGSSSSSRRRAQSYWQWMMESHSFPNQKFPQNSHRLAQHQVDDDLFNQYRILYVLQRCMHTNDFSSQYIILSIYSTS